MAVQQGRSERGGESYSVPYVEPLSDARTTLADFFSILLGVGFRDARHFFDADCFDPFGHDDVALFHRHPGIFVKHLRASAAAPSEELQKMISAHGLCAGWGIGLGLAIGNTAVSVLHGVPFLRRSSMPVAIRDFQVPCDLVIGDGVSSMIGNDL